MEAYAWVMPTSPGGSHFNCIYKCGNDYYLYDDNKKSYGENRIKRIDAETHRKKKWENVGYFVTSQKISKARWRHMERQNVQGDVSNSSLSDEIERLQRHFEDIGIGVRYPLNLSIARNLNRKHNPYTSSH